MRENYERPTLNRAGRFRKNTAGALGYLIESLNFLRF